MGKNRKSRVIGDGVASNLGTLSDISRMKEEIAAREMILLEKALSSDSPHAIVEAKNYISKANANSPQLQSFSFAPDHEFYSGLGFKNKPTSMSYDMLRSMAKTPQIAAVVGTRIDQSMNYTQFTTDTNKPGYTIRKRVGIFAEDKDRDLTDEDKRNIENIYKWIDNGGEDIQEWEREDTSDFFKKVFKDSWEMDQAAYEVAWKRGGIPYQYASVDGGTIRLAETYDDREYQLNRKDGEYLPKYVQVWKNMIYNQYFPFQLCVGMRNVSSDVRRNGYSTSELEVLVQIITWMLYGMQYNGNFFQQGSNPKGFLNFKDKIDQTQIEAFKQNWRNTMTSVYNSHKLAVTSGADVEWINMQQNNRDMEFHQWNEFLTVLSCVVFRIDPDEVGFHLEGSKGMFGQDGQKQRLQHSREKGLEPFLRYWQGKFDQFLVKPFYNGKYEFAFTGISPEDEDAVLERDIKILTNGGMSLQDFFKKYSSKDLNIKKDIILNQIALQYKQLDAQGDPETNAAVEQMDGNPFSEFENGMSKGEDPFLKAFGTYLDSKKSESI